MLGKHKEASFIVWQQLVALHGPIVYVYPLVTLWCAYVVISWLVQQKPHCFELWCFSTVSPADIKSFPLWVSVQGTGLLHIRWIYRWEKNVSSNQPWWGGCWSCPGRQGKATVRVGPVSERERTLCRPVLNGSVATPERLLFSEQLHLAALREAMIPPTPPYSPTKYQLDCSSCDLISRTEVCIEHLQLHKKKVKKKSKAAKSGRLSHNIMCVSEAVKTF